MGVKTINRKLVRFVKNGDKYQIYIVMQGYEFDTSDIKGCVISEKLPLGIIEESQLETFMKFFSTEFYNIDVVG